MAEDDSGQEKTEDATSRRIEKAREEGDIPRSRELATTLLLVGGMIGLWLTANDIIALFSGIFRSCFTLSRDHIFDSQQALGLLGHVFWECLLAFSLFFGVMAAASIIGSTLLGGFLWSAKLLEPKWDRIDPIAGIKRMFSVKALVELIKSILKVFFIVGVSVAVLNYFSQSILSLGYQSVEQGMGEATWIIWICATLMCLSTVFVACLDVPYQLYEYQKKLKMSMQDIKDEMKDSDGKPEVKGRIRQLQRDMAQKRMMADVPKADVIITNPSHYAVALRYDPEAMKTPICLAKGVDQVAFKIREIAKLHKVEIVEAPALSRAIYHTTDIQAEIPAGLYVAVAQVLAYIFQLREFRRGRGHKPDRPKAIRVPRDFYYD
jgi:flagellar biosynthesis protein FlhB